MGDLDIMLSHGFAVGPLDGKIPLTAHGIHDFTSDPDVIARWHGQHPGCNWGATQRGVIVFDVDPRNGGTVTALKLRPEHKTLCVQTGAGGWHIYYRHAGSARGKLRGANGIDIKIGGHGYTVAPGSTHPITGKRYRLHCDIEIAQVPDHLLALIVRREWSPPAAPSRTTVDRWDGLIRAVQEAQPGNRNQVLFWAAARAAADNSPASVYSALAAAGHQIGLSTTEIQQTIQSAQRRAAS